MRLTKISDKGASGNLYMRMNEILFINWTGNGDAQYFSIDASKRTNEISKEYFARLVYGQDYLTIEGGLKYGIENYRVTISENGNRYLCFYQQGVIFGFDKNGKKVYEWEAYELSGGHALYDIECQSSDLLWLAFPTGQTVTQVSLSERKEVQRIGDYTWDDVYEPLNFPEGLSVVDDELFIANMGSKQLYKMDLQTNKLDIEESFNVPIWDYIKTNIGDFIVTNDGVFEVGQEKRT